MRRIRAFAHRGGAGEAAENSLHAFRRAVGLGFTWLETDVRPTRDGIAVLMHDATLDRTTDAHGRVRDRSWSDVRRARLADGTTPLRLEQLLEEFPSARLNLDVKEDGSVAALIDAVDRCAAWDRVCITSFSPSRLRRVRRSIPPGTATSAHPGEVAALRLRSARAPLPRLGSPTLLSAGLISPRPRIQIPPSVLGVRLLLPRLVRAAHAAGQPVDAWTIDEEATMEALIDLGVDGIMTDYPARLRSVLERRGLWDPSAEQDGPSDYRIPS